MEHTKFLNRYNFEFTFMERIWYVLNQKTDILRCNVCGKPLYRRINSLTSDKIPKTCGGKCKSIGSFENRSVAHHNRRAAKLYDKLKTEEVIPCFNLSDFLENYKPKQKQIYHKFKWKCTKCGDVFEDKFNLNFFNRHNHIAHARCYKCHPLSNSAGISATEIEIYDYVRTIYSGEIRQKDKKTLHDKKYRNPFELDIYLPEIKLAIEYNGLYWHGKRISNNSADAKKRVPNSHIVKTKLCENNGIRLIYVWEHDWANSKEEIKNFIRDMIQNKIDYRPYLKNNGGKLILDRSKFNLANNFLHHKVIGVIKPKTETITVQRGKKSKTKIKYKIKTCGYLVLEPI